MENNPDPFVKNTSAEPIVNKDTVFKAPTLNVEEKQAHQNIATLPILTVVTPLLDYTPPPWGCEPSANDHYGFDVIKNGSLIETIKFSGRSAATFVVVGRLASCDIRLEHPSISRYHCILQYGEDVIDRTGKGWHLFDLGSTHGTKLNKRRIPPKQYIRIRVGHVLQFGGSTRIMNLVGPSTDVEEEWEYTPTEMRKLKEQKKLNEKLEKAAKQEVRDEKKEQAEDAQLFGSEYEEEWSYARIREDFDVEENEEKYKKDPLKALSHFFEQEGFDMEFSYTEMGSGRNHKWCCTIELPVDTAAGQCLSATATCSGNKREAQIACALNACRTLDMHGVLYRAANARRRREKILEENDFYDSDEDTFFDRTGQVEKSRENRKRRALEAQGRILEEKETYESLLKKISDMEEQMKIIETRLFLISDKGSSKERVSAEDDLDLFCREIVNNSRDDIATKAEKSQLRLQLTELRHEKEKMEKLAKIAKPVTLPDLKVTSQSTRQEEGKKTIGVSAATMKKLMQLRRVKATISETNVVKEKVLSKKMDDEPFVIEEEDNEEGEEGGGKRNVDDSPSTSGFCDPRSEDVTSPTTTKLKLTEEVKKNTLTKIESENPNWESENLEGATSNSQEINGTQLPEVGIITKRRRVRIRGERGTDKIKNETLNVMDYGEGCKSRDEDYVTWMPPDSQSGDGRTALNAKFAGRY